jgi:hypothetical protein
MAHRVAWTLVNGKIHDGLLVLHACDNPPCCRPSHLRLGTHRDNVLDAVAKGRWGSTLKQFCIRGHEFTTDNTVTRLSGERLCRQCIRIRSREYYASHPDYQAQQYRKRKKRLAIQCAGGCGRMVVPGKKTPFCHPCYMARSHGPLGQAVSATSTPVTSRTSMILDALQAGPATSVALGLALDIPVKSLRCLLAVLYGDKEIVVAGSTSTTSRKGHRLRLWAIPSMCAR